jgi:hypothetical protein
MTNVIVSLPSLNRHNRRTTAIFQTMLIANAPSGLREQQLLTCHIVEFFFFLVLYMKRTLIKLATKFSTVIFFLFWLNTSRFIYLHNK